ncbi:Gp15 family bacteriophage protein [Salinithrix halophila]|uniref:Gp15 family bacteriophage protein n=1 Tax=Salinithrix halophila TaxID=1485204 RepID=A0ABV8JD33_9BACL
MRLTDRFDDDVLEYRGKVLRLRLFFDVVLRAHELISDPDFTDEEKIDILGEMLIDNHEDIADMPPEEKGRLIETIFTRFINREQEDDEPTKEKVLDFVHDAEYIFASFLYDYGIDLFEQHGKLHWKKFLTLLSNLSDDSKFKQVVHIRMMEVPKRTKYNLDEIKQIRELKRVYRLPENGETERERLIKHNEQAFEALAVALRPKGKGGGKDG